jgi:hypothetical protein
MDKDMGGSIAQEVSLRLLIVEARVRNQVSRCRFCGAQSDSGIGFSPSPSVFHRFIIPSLLYIQSCVIWGMDDGAASGCSSTVTYIFSAIKLN